MNRKIFALLALICLSACGRLSAQTGIAENEQYNSYKLCTFLDNLGQGYVPEVFLSNYYGSINLADCKSSQIIDREHKIREVHIKTRKAKDGYLFVNKSIMEYISNNDSGSFDGLKVAYVYNNKAVLTEKDVMDVLRLRKRRIRISEIKPDNQSGVITVYIQSH